MQRLFKTRIYYTSFCEYEIYAENEEEAICKARELKIKEEELLSNLESFKEADEAELKG